MELHVGYCKGFGISREEMEATEEKEGKQPLPFPSCAYRHPKSEAADTGQHAPPTQGTRPLTMVD